MAASSLGYKLLTLTTGNVVGACRPRAASIYPCDMPITMSLRRGAPRSPTNVARTVARQSRGTAWRAEFDQLTHDQPEIEPTSMNQEALRNIGVTAQVRPTHPSGVIETRERALDHLPASPHPPTCRCATSSPAIAIYRRLSRRLLRPVVSTAIRLGHIGAHAYGVEVRHRLIAVIPLVRDELFQRLRLLDVGLRRFDLLGCGAIPTEILHCHEPALSTRAAITATRQTLIQDGFCPSPWHSRPTGDGRGSEVI